METLLFIIISYHKTLEKSRIFTILIPISTSTRTISFHPRGNAANAPEHPRQARDGDGRKTAATFPRHFPLVCHDALSNDVPRPSYCVFTASPLSPGFPCPRPQRQRRPRPVASTGRGRPCHSITMGSVNGAASSGQPATNPRTTPWPHRKPRIYTAPNRQSMAARNPYRPVRTRTTNAPPPA